MATCSIQELGVEDLSHKGSLTNGLSSPIRGFRFTTNFEGLGTTSFKTVEGFGSDVEATDYREGGFGYSTKRKLPGFISYYEPPHDSNLMCKTSHPFFSNPLLYDFYNDFYNFHEDFYTTIEGFNVYLEKLYEQDPEEAKRKLNLYRLDWTPEKN
jgi:hypothetical protein